MIWTASLFSFCQTLLLFCPLGLITCVVTLSIWSITLQLFSWSEKKPSYLLVLCVSAARFLLLLNGEMNEWLFCCKCLYLLFPLWKMINCVLWICWSVRCCGFPSRILVLKVSVWLSVGSFGPEGHRPAVWKKKRRLLQESLSEGFSWNRILTHVCFLSADITHSMSVCVHKPTK